MMSVSEGDADSAVTAIEPDSRRPPRVWKFVGTSLWALLAVAAMFAGQLVVALAFWFAHGGPLDLDTAGTVVSSPAVISWSVLAGLPATVLALWLAIHWARAPLADYLALRGASWKSFLAGALALVALIAIWDGLARILGRDVAPGFMVDVLRSALADGALSLVLVAFCVAAPVTEELLVRGFLYRGWSESFLGPAGAIVLSSLAWTALHMQYYEWFPFAEVFSMGLLFGYVRYRTGSIWVTVFMHGVNNLAATVQTIWLASQS
jgi:membrane protease YdiL (CAAX protease family)